MCPHKPPYPALGSPDREAALPLASHPERGSLCTGVPTFDTGELLPDGQIVAPHRPEPAALVTP
ncbi:DUF5999 family protein [Streptomyces sp. NPDC057302]|uniref:DUF5999 family protein n=1 Tax=Streptomyces sp. NPDC057302 TaxID=3346094 RepID=UPI003642C1E4